MQLNSINLTIEELETIKLITKIISLFSLIGSILIIITICFFKSNRNRSFNLELLQYYAISNLFFAICPFIPYNPLNRKPDKYCAIQSFFITMFQNSRNIWSSIIGYSTFLNCIKKNSFSAKAKNYYRILFISLSFILSAFLALM
jgi:hypothetical protein